jgi:hypothetical protein
MVGIPRQERKGKPTTRGNVKRILVKVKEIVNQKKGEKNEQHSE